MKRIDLSFTKLVKDKADPMSIIFDEIWIWTKMSTSQKRKTMDINIFAGIGEILYEVIQT